MPSAGFEPAIAAIELPQNCALDRTGPGSAQTDTDTCMTDYGVCTVIAIGSDTWNNKWWKTKVDFDSYHDYVILG